MSTVYVLNKDGKPLMPTTQTATHIHLVNVSLLPKTKGLYLH